MNKLKEIVIIVSKSPTPKKDFLYVLWCFSVIPILIIHEGLHILAILLTLCPTSTEKRWIFVERISDNQINGFDFPITLEGKNFFKKYLIASAPLLGYPIALFLCFWIPIHFLSEYKWPCIFLIELLFVYFGWNWEILGMSDADKKTQKYSLKRIKYRMKIWRKNFLYWRKIRIFAFTNKIKNERIKEIIGSYTRFAWRG
jgi:hypothetical protein